MVVLVMVGVLITVVFAEISLLSVLGKYIPDGQSYWHEFKSDSFIRSAKLGRKTSLTNVVWPRP